jgi:hypothetical protein
MQTERFNQLRKSMLSKIFDSKVITKVWREIVRDQLRSLDLKDLFDHYDFNYNIEERAKSIRFEILNGSYQVSKPLIYRIEKKLGICRHLITPHPIDALVFQVLVEHIAVEVLKNQPSENAMFSRSKHKASKPHEVDDYNLSWREQWKKLQKIIYNFNEEKDIIVVTDISNYYDSIDIKELRKVFTSFTKIDEVLIDLLFKIIEEISWRPDYLPYSGRSLPTTNIEGIRLLAHSFLFEIDEVIKQKTNNSFARWMDDITIGVDNKKQATEILSAISDMLKSRGLALNLSKTNIYNSDEGFFHFQIEENRYIDNIENLIKTETNKKKLEKEVYKKFKNHFKNKEAKYWGKITKRYITTFVKLNSLQILPNIPDLYINYPDLRGNLLYYLKNFEYNSKTSEKVIEIIKNIDIFDDLSLYQLCLLVTEWEIPINEKSKEFLIEFENLITKFSKSRKTPSDFYCLLWFKAKYSHPETLLKFINEFQYIWQTDSFLRRQVTAILSRLLITNNISVTKLLSSQISSGVANVVTLATQILTFSENEKLDFKLQTYLFPKNTQRPYPLGKYLVLCSVLNSETIRNDASIKLKIKKHINDPYYLKWLEAQYNIT